MFKKIIACIICIIAIVSLMFLNTYANNVSGYFEDNDQFVILATIIDASDTTYTISCGHILSAPEYSALPEIITVNKFRYGYDSEQADNYNTPHLGDNIIISIKYNGYSYEIRNDVYMVNTVTYSSAFVFIPKELTKARDIAELSSLAYYIRSNGESVEYEYRNDSVFLKDGFEIKPSDYLKIIETDKTTGRQEEYDESVKSFVERNAWIVGTIIIVFGMIIGLVALLIINKKIIR